MRTVMIILLATATAEAQEAAKAFFRKPVDFFNAKPRPKSISTVWEGDRPPPTPVRDLLENPSPETAQRYLEWQRDRLEKLQKALEAIETVKRGDGRDEILYFTREDCPHCREQDRRLGDLAVRRIKPGESPELWTRYGITATPSFVVRDRVIVGVTDRSVLEEKKP